MHRPSTAQARKEALVSLENHPGWHLFVERQKEMIEAEVDAKIFDTATSDEECRALRKGRAAVVNEFGPKRLLARMLKAAETEAEMEKRKQ